MSALPLKVATQLGSNMQDAPHLKIEGFDGVRRPAVICRVHMKFGTMNVEGDFIVLDQEYGILGRDILNCGELVLDGPALKWQFSRPH